jgi:hypothetical protein
VLEVGALGGRRRGGARRRRRLIASIAASAAIAASAPDATARLDPDPLDATGRSEQPIR